MRGRGRAVIIQELQQFLTLDRFSCDSVHGDTFEYQGRTYTPTEFVREKTKLWRESWIFPLLAELLEKETKR